LLVVAGFPVADINYGRTRLKNGIPRPWNGKNVTFEHIAPALIKLYLIPAIMLTFAGLADWHRYNDKPFVAKLGAAIIVGFLWPVWFVLGVIAIVVFAVLLLALRISGELFGS